MINLSIYVPRSRGERVGMVLSALAVVGVGALVYLSVKDKGQDPVNMLPRITGTYERPKVLIGYDRWNHVGDSFDPLNPLDRTPQPSMLVLKDELDRAKAPGTLNRQRAASIENALLLADICRLRKIDYMFASLARDSHYQGMFQRESFPTTVVYCLPAIDKNKALEVEEGHEYAWSRQRGRNVDVQSFHFDGKTLERIVNGGEK